jgi:hypothetical protein
MIKEYCMRIPISEARARLPQLIKQLREDPSLRYEITVRQEIVAELRSPVQLPQGGEAAKQLLAIIDQLPPVPAGDVINISTHVHEHLYPSVDETIE